MECGGLELGTREGLISAACGGRVLAVGIHDGQSGICPRPPLAPTPLPQHTFIRHSVVS